MTPSRVFMFVEPRPAAIATIAIFVLALLVTLVLSRMIRRREAIRAAALLVPSPAISTPRTQRATDANMPLDVQERLRFLTAGIDTAFGHDPGDGKGKGSADSQERHGSAASHPGTAMRNDTPQYFGEASNLAADEDLQAHASAPRGVRADSTARFFAEGLETGAEGDATRFFGDGVDARDLFGEEPEHTTAPGEQDDMTRLFGAEDDDSGTPLPSETRFFTPAELDQEGNGSALATDGYTGTTPLQALPSSPARVDTGALNSVRARLAAAAGPEVIALSVLDGAGRVLAGATDDDLAGELRSLMAESGQGNTADVEQPILLDDDSRGALLLLPTGANALLGALVREAGDPQATRARLRGLAHEIGDAMRRAS